MPTVWSAHAEEPPTIVTFAPAAGVDEDPVTGSAHCALGPYWQPRLGKDEMLAYQASARVMNAIDETLSTLINQVGGGI